MGWITAMDEHIDRVMMAGGYVHTDNQGNDASLTSTATICSQSVPFSFSDLPSCGFDECSQEAFRAESLIALDKYGTLEGLNSSQCLAVQGAVSNRLTLVQGPPGTGASHNFILFDFYSRSNFFHRENSRGNSHLTALG